MLKTIKATCFQRHEYIELKLDPHVTVLVGNNGTGKSAIIRAIIWCALNKWAGKADAFIRWGADNARVELEFTEGTIARQKGKDGNLFILNDVNLENDLSRSIPDAIKKLANLTEDNFHEQLDPAFWFSLTAGQVAKSLNKIVNLTSIDDSLADVASKLRTVKEEYKVALARRETARNIKISLDWTKAADEELSQLEDMQRDLEEKRAASAALARKLQEMAVTTKVRDGARAVILSGRSVIEKMDKISILRKKAQLLGVHLSRTGAGEKALAIAKASLTKARPKLQEAQSGMCPLCKRS